MKRIFLLLVYIILTTPAFCQIEADSIFIYKNFNRAGSTARLILNHKELATRKASMVKLSQLEISELKNIFFGTRKKRFFQQKHRGNICYALVWFKGKKYNYIMEGSESFARMVNLNTKRKWTLEDVEKVRTFFNLIKKNWL